MYKVGDAVALALLFFGQGLPGRDLIDGRGATLEDVGEHRKATRFEKHYKNGASLNNPLGRDIPLLFDQNHRYVGRRVVRGELCHKTEFVDRNPSAKLPARARLAYVLKGDA